MKNLNQIEVRSLPSSSLQTARSHSKFTDTAGYCEILELLKQRTSHDFSGYKISTIRRRIERRKQLCGTAADIQYLDFLRSNAAESQLLFQDLLIGVTSFFRDAKAFMHLEKVLFQYLANQPVGKEMRIWIPGCGTGEEAYSVAMIMHDVARRLKRARNFKIFATDLNSYSIEMARRGYYPLDIAQSVGRERLSRFFNQQDHFYFVKSEIRNSIVFAQHNLTNDPPFTKLDLISCRNLMIYLESHVQRQMLHLFGYALLPEGILLLGNAETVGNLNHVFATVDKYSRLFKRVACTTGHSMQSALKGKAEAQNKIMTKTMQISGFLWPAPADQQKLSIERQSSGQFSALINQDRETLHAHGVPEEILKLKRDFLDLVHDELREPLAASIKQVQSQSTRILQRRIVALIGGVPYRINLSVSKVSDVGPLTHLLMVTMYLQDVSLSDFPFGANCGASEKSRSEVQEKRSSKTIVRVQKAYDDLQQANERLQSNSEELQVMNEELETSREESQSLNEELQTINTELQKKVDELSQHSDDWQNLLNGTDIATVFLDSDLKIKRFTNKAKELIHLIPGDVGRPISDLSLDLPRNQLIKDAKQVLKSLKLREAEIQARAGSWLLMRISPYRTCENVVNGVVITFVDIQKVKQAQEMAQEALTLAENIVQTIRDPLIILSDDFMVVSANDAFYKICDLARSKVEKRNLFKLDKGHWNIPELRTLLEKVLPKNSSFQDIEITWLSPHGPRQLLVNARKVKQAAGRDNLILMVFRDITRTGAADRSPPAARTQT